MRYFIMIWAFCFYNNSFAQKVLGTDDANMQSGYEIKVRILPFQNQKIYISSYFGNSRFIVDSAFIDKNNEAVFRKNRLLPGGMYVICNKSYQGMVDLILDTSLASQRFSVNINYSDHSFIVIETYN